MKVAILCNGVSDEVTDRIELVQELKNKGLNVYVGGIVTEKINDYYSKETAKFLPIKANRKNTNPFVEIKSILSVKKQIKKNKIELIIIYGVKNHAAMAIGAKLGGAHRILCVVNGSGNLFKIAGLKGKLIRFMSYPMLKIAYSLSNAVCFQNTDDKQLFERKWLISNQKKMFVTGGSGVNLEIFPEQPLPKENRFLFLARITPSKGIEEFINAARIVKKKYKNAEFDIVGPYDVAVETSENNYLKKACDNKIVHYHGATKNVSEWMGKARFFVYPSYYPEGVPRCAMQAIATGRPIITCNVPGCKELVKNGINGFIVPKKDSIALAKKMIWMIENPYEVEKMSKESRTYAEERFDVNKINEMLIKKLL